MKIKKRIIVVIDAEFGIADDDERGGTLLDRDENAYVDNEDGHANILGAIADGTITGHDYKRVYIELGSGDVVKGELVNIDATDPPGEHELTNQAAFDIEATMYTDICNVVERAWMHAPVEMEPGEPRCTSDYAREATNRILEIVREAAREMAELDGAATAADLDYDDQVLDERDEAVQAADELTSVVEQITGIDAGDHSNMNEPWKNAIEAGTAYANSTDFEYGIRWRQRGAIHRDGMTEEQARNFVHPEDWEGSPVPVGQMFEIVRRRRGAWQVVP